MVEMRSAHKIVGVNLRGSGRSRYRWEDNIKMDLEEMVYGVAQDRIHLQALVNRVINLWAQEVGNFLAK
jgi:uncharacterized protein involved in tolerance to divalent cations